MNNNLLQPKQQVLSTLEGDGSRRWLYPRLFQGKYWNLRKIFAYFLTILFVALPHITINNKPAMLLDIKARQFTFFGFTFLPTDTVLLAFFMLSLFLTIFLLTAIFGRIWCGWACPQTVYLEFVYRPIERLFCGTTGKGGKPKQKVSGPRIVGMYACYLVISVILAHSFLAYFVGVEQLSQWVRQSPFSHPVSFLVMFGTTFLMMFNFSFFREQLCVLACPYGRFQSVLLDRQSLIVSYDQKRGEPRGKKKKQQNADLPILGDCIDCGLCVHACPTGIDIRNGLQMECLHCTQCMDACDSVMEKINRPLGLIRYSCQDAIEGLPFKMLRPRVIIYPMLLAIAFGAFTWTLINSKSFDAIIFRNLGSPYTVQTIDEVKVIQNNMELKLVNRLDIADTLKVTVKSPSEVTIDLKAAISLEPNETKSVPILISAPADLFVTGSLALELQVDSEQGDTRVMTCNLVGP